MTSEHTQSTLECIVKGEEPLTLRQELSQSIHAYPKTLKEYFKQLAPAVVVSSLGSALGQYGATELGYDTKFATTAAAYVCGYIPGYTTFFTLEYLKNQNKYPAVFSKEFGGFVSTFMAADYVADMLTFTPVFIASNIWLTDNTALNPALRSIIAWNTASVLYIASISALHPVTRRISQALNKHVRSLYQTVRKKFGQNSATS